MNYYVSKNKIQGLDFCCARYPQKQQNLQPSKFVQVMLSSEVLCSIIFVAGASSVKIAKSHTKKIWMYSSK